MQLIKINKRQRKLIKKFLAKYHNREKVYLIKVFQAVAYLVKTGCQWRMLPTYFPRPTTVYYHFRKWNNDDGLIKFLHRLNTIRRVKQGRNANPVMGMVDSQSVRSALPQSQKGVDGFKKVKGIKRQILVDSIGNPLLIYVTTANVYDSKGAGHLINSIRTYYPTIALVKADKGYVGAEHNHENFRLECVKSNFGTSEFIPLEGRWVVERFNSWLDNYRRLCRNYEQYLSTAKTMAYFACVMIMLKSI